MGKTKTKRWQPGKYDPPPPVAPEIEAAETALAEACRDAEAADGIATNALDKRDRAIRDALEAGSSLKRCAAVAGLSKAMVARIRDGGRSSTPVGP